MSVEFSDGTMNEGKGKGKGMKIVVRVADGKREIVQVEVGSSPKQSDC